MTASTDSSLMLQSSTLTMDLEDGRVSGNHGENDRLGAVCQHGEGGKSAEGCTKRNAAPEKKASAAATKGATTSNDVKDNLCRFRDFLPGRNVAYKVMERQLSQASSAAACRGEHPKATLARVGFTEEWNALKGLVKGRFHG